MSIVDVPGIAVGSVEDAVALTGCSVVICDEPAVCGVDVRGGAPGIRETDLLQPTSLVERVDAIVLAGGSAFGLDAASGVVAFLEQRGRGYAVGGLARADRPRRDPLRSRCRRRFAATGSRDGLSSRGRHVALATGGVAVRADVVGALSADAVAEAIVRAVRAARSVGSIPGLAGA